MTNAARTALTERLQQAQREQTKTIIHLRGARLEGIVTRIENDLVQLRQPDGKPAHIVLESIDALTTE